MTVTLNPLHGRTLHASFVPLAAMTPRQQAEHLVYAHGFNQDYFDAGQYDDEEDCIAAFLRGFGFPGGEAKVRADWHDGDHEYLLGDPEVLACRHDHEREVRE